MSDPKKRPTEASIEERLRSAWRQERRFLNLRGAARFVVWCVVVVLLDFVIDWGILSKSDAKLGALLPFFNFGVLAWALWYEWLRHLKPYDPVRVALEIEARHPELSSLLVSYTQLKGTLDKQPNVSRDLVEAMRVEAVDRTRPLDFSEIVNFGQLRRVMWVTLGSLLVFGAIGFNWSAHFGTLFQRLAGVEARYPTETTVGELEDLVVRAGDSLEIAASASGVLPDVGELLTRPWLDEGARGEWKSLPLERLPAGVTYSRKLEELSVDLEYFVRLGDDECEPRRITVVPSPRVVASRLRLEYPEYMGRDPGRSDQLNLEVPQGTTVHWELDCAPAVKRLEVRVSRGASAPEIIEAELDEAGSTARFQLLADHASKYTFHWTERGSGRDFEYDNVQHSLRVVADTVPEVELLRPTAGGLATAKKTQRLDLRARDDHGLSKAWLVYSVDSSAEERVEIRDFAGVTALQFSYPWVLASSIPDLKSGMRVSFAVEVGDLHPSGEEHVRRSATRQLTIVEPERYLEWYRAELAAQNDEIRRAIEDERTASRRIGEIEAQEGRTP